MGKYKVDRRFSTTDADLGAPTCEPIRQPDLGGIGLVKLWSRKPYFACRTDNMELGLTVCFYSRAYGMTFKFVEKLYRIIGTLVICKGIGMRRLTSGMRLHVGRCGRNLPQVPLVGNFYAIITCALLPAPGSGRVLEILQPRSCLNPEMYEQGGPRCMNKPTMHEQAQMGKILISIPTCSI